MQVEQLGKGRISVFGQFKCYEHTFRLGCIYGLNFRKWDFQKSRWITNTQNVQFIQVTRKGFNLLNLRTDKCILKNRHLYDYKYLGKELPAGKVLYNMRVPLWVPYPIPQAEKNKEEA